MNSRRYVIRETAVLAIGEAVCAGILLGVAALLGWFNRPVVLGTAIGAVLGMLNFFLMAVGVDAAADRATQQDVKGGQSMVRLSFLLRMVLMFGVLAVFAKTGLGNPIAMVIPILAVRPIITIAEFFRKTGE